MSTFPRRVDSKLLFTTSPVTSSSLVSQETAVGVFQVSRPVSETPLSSGFDFDAGINSSNAWTRYLEHGTLKGHTSHEELSLEDEQYEEQSISSDPLSETIGRLAVVLYDFSGEDALGELSVKAGDSIEVLQESVASNIGDSNASEGWSLARADVRTSAIDDGPEADKVNVDDARLVVSVGLVPRAYYIFSDNKTSLPPSRSPSNEDIHADDTLTPRVSVLATFIPPSGPSPAPPPSLSPQTTGEWFRAQLRRGSQLLGLASGTLLGGLSLNRFSRFVTSGAEGFILNGVGTEDVKEKRREVTEDISEGLPVQHEWRFSTYLAHDRQPTEEAQDDSDRNPNTHIIDVGPSWHAKVPPFTVRVHSPEKRQPMDGERSSEPYIVYCVTSTFSEHTSNHVGRSSAVSPAVHSMSVYRRFSHFVRLRNVLAALLPGIAMPPLPEKAYAGRFNADFVEARRGELDRYMRKLISHPVVRYTDSLTFFLSCEDEMEFHRELPRRLRLLSPFSQQGWGERKSFFSNVYHPDFHFDVEDAEEASSRFALHSRAVSQGVQQLRSNFGRVREARGGMASVERMLSYSLLSLITSTPFQSDTPEPLNSYSDSESDEEGVRSPALPNGKGSAVPRTNGHRPARFGLLNDEGAWCWRDDCAGCLRLTKCMQKTAETLQGVADLFDDHANRVLYATEDKLKDVAHPNLIYSPILDIHDGTLRAYKHATSRDVSTPKEASEAGATGSLVTQSPMDIGISARCETVLNTTMAELEVYHTQKLDDFESLTKGYLDNEIDFYEKLLSRLRTTRDVFDARPEELALTMPGMRQPSVYESALREPSMEHLIAPRPLTRPCPHVLDRPGTIGSALQGGAEFLVAGVSGRSVSRTV